MKIIFKKLTVFKYCFYSTHVWRWSCWKCYHWVLSTCLTKIRYYWCQNTFCRLWRKINTPICRCKPVVTNLSLRHMRRRQMIIRFPLKIKTKGKITLSIHFWKISFFIMWVYIYYSFCHDIHIYGCHKQQRRTRIFF